MNIFGNDEEEQEVVDTRVISNRYSSHFLISYKEL